MISKNHPLVSIIIPCFNSGNILRRAIDSILNQSWPSIQIVLVNDGSEDQETLEVFNSYKNLSQLLLINQKNLGLPAARNNGVKNSSGEFLYFLDSDDWIEPKAIELFFNFLKKNNEQCYVYSDIILEGATKNILKKEFNFFEQMFINQIPYSIFISKKNWLMNKGYDELMLNGYEDWDFNIRLGSLGFYGKRLSRPLFHYNVSYSGMLLSKSSKIHPQLWKYIVKKNSKLYKLKKMYFLFKEWRNKPSSYPLIIFFLWYYIFFFSPEIFASKLFIIFRNFKWFFTRKKYTYYD